MAWLTGLAGALAFVSVASIGELRRGIERLPSGRRQDTLREWLVARLLPQFEARVLPINLPIADGWGRLVAARERQGRPIATMDALIAATAHIYRLTLLTRNVADFEGSVDAILNPWS